MKGPLTPYLGFNGCCEEALNFYARVLGGQVGHVMRFADAPFPCPPDKTGWVMHTDFRAGPVYFMASDMMAEACGPSGETGAVSNVSLSFDLESAEEQERVFHALAEGGKVTMALQNTFWGARFGTLTDKFGIQWMFNFDLPKA